VFVCEHVALVIGRKRGKLGGLETFLLDPKPW
jgi:hypothetical protein